ncbi:hypothetical protein GJ496_002534 [Pomphorhynchus laevis]|nr:hypothetical protein GJ496_002534 [Pomphorhynchus laevis]
MKLMIHVIFVIIAVLSTGCNSINIYNQGGRDQPFYIPMKNHFRNEKLPIDFSRNHRISDVHDSREPERYVNEHNSKMFKIDYLNFMNFLKQNKRKSFNLKFIPEPAEHIFFPLESKVNECSKCYGLKFKTPHRTFAPVSHIDEDVSNEISVEYKENRADDLQTTESYNDYIAVKRNDINIFKRNASPINRN